MEKNRFGGGVDFHWSLDSRWCSSREERDSQYAMVNNQWATDISSGYDKKSFQKLASVLPIRQYNNAGRKIESR